MAYVIPLSSTGTGTRVDLNTLDSAFVAEGRIIGSTNGTAIKGTGSLHEVTIAGQVSGLNSAVELGDAASDTGQFLRITTSGVASSNDSGAVELRGGGSQLINEGAIDGLYGVIMGGTGTTSRIFNSGSIVGQTHAILRLLDATNTLEIVNEGRILALSQSPGARAITHNETNAIETVINRGFIQGQISLGAGSDTVDNRDGVIWGQVYLDTGTDRFVAGAGAETVSGGSGADTVDYSFGAGARLVLGSGAAGGGGAQGDMLTAIENVTGSINGADTITGNGAINRLVGNGGADRLSGAGGSDTLVGGQGRDVLTGGAGNDRFVFNDLTEAGDKILDFSSSASGNNDGFRIDASAFGAGLTAGGLDPSKLFKGASNLASGTEDRFVFRTTDATLWFDKNGSAAGGLTLLADLQDGATLTASDIILI